MSLGSPQSASRPDFGKAPDRPSGADGGPASNPARVSHDEMLPAPEQRAGHRRDAAPDACRHGGNRHHERPLEPERGRFLAEFSFRFNGRFSLREMLPAAPMLNRPLKLAENHA